ncbi:uncharacterized protein LOC5506836 [Nematostella vectensis]|nr:uncharacterized protein LOC5506836 [Nematostella vectensis]
MGWTQNILFALFSDLLFWRVAGAVSCPVECKRLCNGRVPGRLDIGNTTIVLTKAICFGATTDIPKGLSKNLGDLTVSRSPLKLLKNTSFQDYQYLKWLDLSNNDISDIQDGTFENLRYLKQLNLGENKIRTVSASMFKGLVSLEKLDLRFNDLKALPRGVFKPLKSLRELFLHDNRNMGSRIEEGAFNGLDNLRKLHVSATGMKKITQGTFGSLMSLEFLDVSFNEIRHFDEESLACLPLLEVLHINNNSLTTVPLHALRKVKFLKELDLSANLISYVSSTAFANNSKLQKLLLHNNTIRLIHEDAFSQLKGLRALFLRGNPFQCDCQLNGFHAWLRNNQYLVNFNGHMYCMTPDKLTGRDLLELSSSDLKCDCLSCTRAAKCDRELTCTCNKKWEGSCNAICTRTSNATSSCVTLGDQCHCPNVTLPKPLVSKCTFTITNKTCSVNGELRNINRRLECVCKSGYHGDGVTCEDIDECDIAHHCDKLHATCINTPGSHTCRCNKGYIDKIPALPGKICINENECLRDSGICGTHALCSDLEGSYLCTCEDQYKKVSGRCYPQILQEDIDIGILAVNSTAVYVLWSISVKHGKKATSCRIMYLELGQDFKAFMVGATYTAEAERGILGNLRPDTSYWIKIMVSTAHNISTESIVKQHTTEKQYTGGRETTKDPTSNKGIIAGTVVAVVVAIATALVLVLCCGKKKRKKSSQAEQNVFLQPSVMEDIIELRHSTGPTITITPEMTSKEGHKNTDPSLVSFSMESDRMDVWEIPRDCVTLGDRIGEGQFGIVFAGTVKIGEDTIKAAIKCIKDVDDRYDMKDLKLEMEMMKEIGYHPNVVSLIGTCTIETPLYIITEYVSGGNLLDQLRQSRRTDSKYVNVNSTLTSRDLLRIALDVSRGMRHIAMKKFVHRDLAARNVLMTDTLTAKVADFGLARDIYCEGKYVKTGGGRLPIKWMAPEAIRDQVYTTQTDVWSFGVLLWEIVTLGRSPYPGVPIAMLLEKLLYGYKMPCPSHCSEEVYSVMESCWQLEPSARPGFGELSKILTEMLSDGRVYVNMEEYCESLVDSSRESLDDL